MEILSSRVLLRSAEPERAVRFYGETLGLAVYREWGEGPSRGVVFFLGGGFLEISGRSEGEGLGVLELWLQVRDVRAAERDLRGAGVPIEEPPERKPWGLLEMAIRDPDGVRILVVEVPEDHPLRRRSG